MAVIVLFEPDAFWSGRPSVHSLALATVAGKPAIEWVLQNVGSETASGIVLVGTSRTADWANAHGVPARSGQRCGADELSEWILSSVASDGVLLFLQADCVLADTNAVDWLLSEFGRSKADVLYPMVTAREAPDKFPFCDWRAHRFAGRDLVPARAAVLSAAALESTRTKVLKLLAGGLDIGVGAKVLGVSLLMRIGLGLASTDEVAAAVSRWLGVKVKIAVTHDSALAFVLSDVRNMAAAEEFFLQRRS